MQPRVTAILVARNGAAFLDRTLRALAAQTRRADATVFVDAGSTDATPELLAAGGPTQLVTASARQGMGRAVAHAVHVAVPTTDDDDWLWVLAHDNAPHPRALASLLAAVEIAPSVAVAGPKLMRWDSRATIAEYGETITRFGTSIGLVENELDQAQHDRQSDLLAVAWSGMLVRRSVWADLGGFDPGLPSIDAALDFCVRARLAGHRVVGVPAARVATAGGPEVFGRDSVSAHARATLARKAQLHRRLVYSPAALLPVHWLALLPLALLRALAHLARKRPSRIGGEFSAALQAAFSSRVSPARRNLRKTRRLGWSAIRPFRMSARAAREHRAQQREIVRRVAAAPPRNRVGFLAGGGAWVVVLLAAVGIVAFSPLFGAAAVSGGGLSALSSDIGTIWSNAGYGWHEVGGGFVGPADPFVGVIAVIASLTFWSPSLSIVLLYLAALPLAALGAWWCAVRISERAWPPAVAALLWALAPPFLASLAGGHLGAVLAHLLLPWLVLAAITATRSWSAAAAAALLLAAVTAAAPILAPALVLALVGWMIARPTRIHRLIGIVIPATVLFAPLVYVQLARGNPFGWLAEPGIPVAGTAASGWQLVLGFGDSGAGGWAGIGGPLPGPVVVAVLLAPLAVLALFALFVPGGRRSFPSLGLALLGFATAALATRLELSLDGAQAVSVWPAPGLSLMWLGLLGAVIVALEAIRRAVALPALAVTVAAAAAVFPLLAAPLAGTAAIAGGSGVLLPAFVSAEAAANPSLGTLQLDPQTDGALAVTLHRGQGTTLDETSTLASTTTSVSDEQLALAVLAANLASDTGLDTAEELRALRIGFVLLTGDADAPGGAAAAGDAAEDAGAADAGAADAADAGAADAADAASAGEGLAREARQRAAAALDGNSELAPIGDTAQGLLWHFPAGTADMEPVTAPVVPAALGVGIAGGQALVFFVTLLLAIPTSRGRGRSHVAVPDEPIGIDEEQDA